MDLQTLSLLKIAVIAGLALLSYFKTKKILQVQRRAFVQPQECIIKKIETQDYPKNCKINLESRKISDTSSFDNFVSIYDDLRIQQQIEEEEIVQQDIQLSPHFTVNFQKLQMVSTLAPETRRQTISNCSQAHHAQEVFFNQESQQQSKLKEKQLYYAHILKRIQRNRKKRISEQKRRRERRPKQKISKASLFNFTK